MKYKFWPIIAILFFSCSDDIEIENIPTDTGSVKNEEIRVLNGRIYFPNKTTFQHYYAGLREKDQNGVADILERNFYTKEFYSLKPIVNEKTELLQVQRHIAKIKKNKKGLQQSATIDTDELLEKIDGLEDVFGEAVFASLLNQEAELQVADSIYKYTDVGLFIANQEKIDHLNTYLDKKQISRNLLAPTPKAMRLAYLREINPHGGHTTIKQDYQHFIVNTGGSHSGESREGLAGNYSPSGSSKGYSSENKTPNAQLAVISNTLEEDDGSPPWLGNLFGTTKVCIDKYKWNKRVKTKYYNIDLYLAYVIGIKTKHQKKGWTGFWRKQKTDEVALGVNSLTWKFEPPKLTTTFPNFQPTRIYLYNGKMFENRYGYYQSIAAGVPMPNLPFANKVDCIVEAVIGFPFSPFDDEEDVRKYFYKQAFNAAKKLVKDYSDRQLKKVGVVIATRHSTWVQFYDFSESCTNCSKKRRTIDFGIVSPKIAYTFGTGNGGVFSVTSWNFDFRNPSLTGMNAFGMAKRNGQWYGKRMVF